MDRRWTVTMDRRPGDLRRLRLGLRGLWSTVYARGMLRPVLVEIRVFPLQSRHHDSLETCDVFSEGARLRSDIAHTFIGSDKVLLSATV
jgi:hypothetical protein